MKYTVEVNKVGDGTLFVLNINVGAMPLGKAQEYVNNTVDRFKKSVDKLNCGHFEVFALTQRD